jgi:hypothetical protein
MSNWATMSVCFNWERQLNPSPRGWDKSFSSFIFYFWMHLKLLILKANLKLPFLFCSISLVYAKLRILCSLTNYVVPYFNFVVYFSKPVYLICCTLYYIINTAIEAIKNRMGATFLIDIKWPGLNWDYCCKSISLVSLWFCYYHIYLFNV